MDQTAEAFVLSTTNIAHCRINALHQIGTAQLTVTHYTTLLSLWFHRASLFFISAFFHYRLDTIPNVQSTMSKQ